MINREMAIFIIKGDTKRNCCIYNPSFITIQQTFNLYFLPSLFVAYIFESYKQIYGIFIINWLLLIDFFSLIFVERLLDESKAAYRAYYREYTYIIYAEGF